MTPDQDADFAVKSTGPKETGAGPTTDPVRAGKAKPKSAPKASRQSEDQASDDSAPKLTPEQLAEQRRKSEQMPTIDVSAQQLGSVFDAQRAAARQHAIDRLCREYEFVRELVSERDALKAQLEALKAEKAG